MADGSRMETLTRQEALSLLGSTQLGRVVFSRQALPAIRPVNHLLDADRIVIRTGAASTLAQSIAVTGELVVAYEADDIDPRSRVGWSVIVVGRAARLLDQEAAARYRTHLQPWVAGELDDIVVIKAEMVDGFRLVDASPA